MAGRIYGTGYELRKNDLIGDVCRKSYIYAAIGEALNLPIYLVRSPFHVFVRYQMDSNRYVNWETTSMSSVPDSYYATTQEISPVSIENGTYLKNLSYHEALGSVCNTVGNLHLAGGNEEKAFSLYNRGIPLDSMNPLLYYNRGAILFQSKRFEAARKDLEKAVQLDPNYHNAREMLAGIR